MIEVKDLLSKYANLLSNGDLKKETLRKILSETINTEIKREDMIIKNGTLYLNIKPIYKSEILLKKEQILQRINLVLGSKSPYEIR